MWRQPIILLLVSAFILWAVAGQLPAQSIWYYLYTFSGLAAFILALVIWVDEIKESENDLK